MAQIVFLFLVCWSAAFAWCIQITTSISIQIDSHQKVAVHRVPLQRNNPDLPSNYCYAVSNPSDLVKINFLATQVWPSARVAAQSLIRFANAASAAADTSPQMPKNHKHSTNNEATSDKNHNHNHNHILKRTTVCELGCGPGLPALTSAALGSPCVYATDIEPLALALVNRAAAEQGWADRVHTSIYDLTACLTSSSQQPPIQKGSKTLPQSQDLVTDLPPHADLYILSDVFESSKVARGAARVVHRLLSLKKSRVWVFAQTDRSQRDQFLETLQLLENNPQLSWRLYDSGDSYPFRGEQDGNVAVDGGTESLLWLCSIDETTVSYG
ncbi:hypothetical protein ACA910_005773 [Epithemia clementina (nom. ined.)]